MTREDAIEMCKSIKDYLTGGNPVWSKEEVAEAMTMAIEALQVDLVRCGECKYQDKGENEREAWNLCAYRPWLYKPTSDNYFCADGKRRSNE